MQFEDQEIDLNIPDRRIRVRVKADLIHLLWGEGVGPQTAEAIVLANMETIRIIAEKKADATGAGSIEIGEADYDSDEEAEALPDNLAPEETHELYRRHDHGHGNYDQVAEFFNPGRRADY